MKYYRAPNREIFGIDEGQDHLIKSDWVEITEAEALLPPPLTPDQIKLERISELREKLSETDHKDLPSYDRRDTPEWKDLMKKRQSWREEIRNLEKQIKRA